MASNLECVGLGLDDPDDVQRLLTEVLRTADVLGRDGDLTVHRWQDPSGVRIVVATRGGRIVELLPSYAGEPGPSLANVQNVNDQVTIADVVDDDGDTVARFAAEFEQRRLLPSTPATGRAAVVALGVDVTVHADADAFAASDDSLLSPRSAGEPDEPPAHYVEQGWQWPPRMAATSFISYGLFGDPDSAEAYARLNGTVRSAARRTVAATGQQFIAARVHCGVFEADVCLPVDAGTADLAPGNVIAGTVFLVASLAR
ncbi:hypothetical protein Daura_27165 [Dactylosporangium aurantiacum]|uniref:Uncharacterized protein n=1 Tax=Dactylosporangium aurantiacum TaxID=35754 RepID=A0A9Q9IAN6_9ACTN|nr:hypothetical protein [Dactylosporangium aurantiacum]MDG6106453.1 hypothetical protein [Dactylosporangium aurantiacum]UWZ50512.1 hypothetical protein Daura_27165 [Dactylosporangium aurantiacum]